MLVPVVGMMLAATFSDLLVELLLSGVDFQFSCPAVWCFPFPDVMCAAYHTNSPMSIYFSRCFLAPFLLSNTSSIRSLSPRNSEQLLTLENHSSVSEEILCYIHTTLYTCACDAVNPVAALELCNDGRLTNTRCTNYTYTPAITVQSLCSTCATARQIDQDAAARRRAHRGM